MLISLSNGTTAPHIADFHHEFCVRQLRMPPPPTFHPFANPMEYHTTTDKLLSSPRVIIVLPTLYLWLDIPRNRRAGAAILRPTSKAAHC